MSLQHYRDEAARQRSAAEASPLQNVRERCERAAQAWDALAVRNERADAARAQAASDKLLAGMGREPVPARMPPADDDR